MFYFLNLFMFLFGHVLGKKNFQVPELFRGLCSDILT